MTFKHDSRNSVWGPEFLTQGIIVNTTVFTVTVVKFEYAFDNKTPYFKTTYTINLEIFGDIKLRSYTG